MQTVLESRPSFAASVACGTFRLEKLPSLALVATVDSTAPSFICRSDPTTCVLLAVYLTHLHHQSQLTGCHNLCVQVLGTLIDQLTYPEQGTQRDVSEPELRTILEQVDLAYLLERTGVLSDETNWEEAISLGEKQVQQIIATF